MRYLLLFDLLGTFVFAVSGAILGVRKGMDLYGLFVLALAVAVGGGTLRDVLLGNVPPLVLKDPRYLVAVVVAVLLVAALAHEVERRWDYFVVADAVGLGVFTFIGASKGAAAGLHWYGVLLTAVITGTGGGMLRDLLAGEIPFVLRREVYASACLAGGGLFWVLNTLGVPLGFNALLTSLTVVGIRLFTLKKGIGLPVVTPKGRRLFP